MDEATANVSQEAVSFGADSLSWIGGAHGGGDLGRGGTHLRSRCRRVLEAVDRAQPCALRRSMTVHGVCWLLHGGTSGGRARASKKGWWRRASDGRTRRAARKQRRAVAGIRRTWRLLPSAALAQSTTPSWSARGLRWVRATALPARPQAERIRLCVCVRACVCVCVRVRVRVRVLCVAVRTEEGCSSSCARDPLLVPKDFGPPLRNEVMEPDDVRPAARASC